MIDIQNVLRDFGLNYDNATIIHVHDPFLLPVAAKLKKKFKTAKIVYDRHEAYEIFDSKNNLPNRIQINSSRILERLSQNKIDGIVIVSDEFQNICRSFFPDAILTVIPNFPEIDDYCDSTINSKIQIYNEDSNVNLIYFGSLGNNFDRDINLLLNIAEKVLNQYPKTRFFLGGQTKDSELLDKLKLLSQTYPTQFYFSGYTLRDDVAEITQKAHIGFFLIRPETSYWVKSSPNKIYEYLACGVVPVIRADCEGSSELSTCSLLFDRNASNNEIILEVMRLIGDPNRLKTMMRDAFELRYKYSYESVKSRYLTLYRELLNA